MGGNGVRTRRQTKALAEATTKEGGNGEVEAETEGEAGQREAMTDTECGRMRLWLGLVRY